MPIVTHNDISNYLKTYGNFSGLTFTNEVIKTLGLDTKRIYLKMLNQHWPCIIYSCSMHEAKVLINIEEQIIDTLQNSNNSINLRFYLKNKSKTSHPIAFFVPCKIQNYTPYQSKKGQLFFISLNFTQRPPDDLVSSIGRILDANEGFKKRKEERIEIDPISLKRLDLKSKITFTKIENKTIKCILRDISFSGALLILPCVTGVKKDIKIKIAYDFDEAPRPFLISGKIVRIKLIEHNKFIEASILYDSETIPFEYKMAINEYLKKKNSYLQERNIGQIK